MDKEDIPYDDDDWAWDGMYGHEKAKKAKRNPSAIAQDTLGSAPSQKKQERKDKIIKERKRKENN